MLFVYYPKCSTCRKAKKWLEENNLEFQEKDIVEDNPTVEELKEWYEKSDLPLKRFFNTSGMKYRELNKKNGKKNYYNFFNPLLFNFRD